MYLVIKRLKAELKVLAQSIQQTQHQLKDAQRAALGGGWGSVPYRLSGTLAGARYEFRHRHIVRCLLRGRTMQQIENTPRCANEDGRCRSCGHPDEQYIEKLMKEFQDEALRNLSRGSVPEPASGPGGTCGGRMVLPEPTAVEPVEPNPRVPESPGPVGPGNFMERAEEIFRKCWRDLLA